MSNSGKSFRFDVAFSFAGPHREKVRAIAERVRTAVGDGRVFFDEWFEPELLGDDMDLLLQRFYHEQSLMVVADLSDEYSDRQWCQAEARAIRSLRFKIDSARDETGRLRLLNARFGAGRVPGVFDTSGHLDGITMGAEQCATLIVQRLALLRQRLESAKGSPPASATPEAAGFSSGRNSLPPVHLHYLCDRSAEEGALGQFISKTTLESFSRPILVIVHGDSREAHAVFVERMCRHYLPARLKQLGRAGDIQIARPSTRLTSSNAAALAQEVPQKIAAELQIDSPCASDAELIECFRQTRAPLIAPVFDFSSREAFAGEQCYVEMLVDYWSQFPDLPPGVAVICFVCVKYVAVDPPGFLSRWLSSKKPDRLQQLRTLIANLGTEPKTAGAVKVIHRILLELRPVKVADVDMWFQSSPVSGRVHRRLFYDAIQREIFKNRDEMPMEHVLEELEKFMQT